MLTLRPKFLSSLTLTSPISLMELLLPGPGPCRVLPQQVLLPWSRSSAQHRPSSQDQDVRLEVGLHQLAQRHLY